ncbi:MAG: S-ribosylhomocysteine lyase [Clostridia bacterium]|nr:S-ribosylhomocysteine lyase [Clostridia bacterium]
MTFTEIPGSKREECGNYLEHDLSDALKECKKYLEILNNL